MTAVTFTTVPAKLPIPPGSLQYRLITAVQVGERLMSYDHPARREHVQGSVSARKTRLTFPTLMASRLRTFTQTCFVEGGVRYDPWDFMAYLARQSRHLAPKDRQPLKLKSQRTVTAMQALVFCNAEGRPTMGGIVVSSTNLLCVLGPKGPMALVSIPLLKMAYGKTLARPA